MADKKEHERYEQKAEGAMITNIPPENLAFIQQLKEKQAKKAEKE